MSQHDRARLVVTCPDCAAHEAVDGTNEAVAYYRRHHAITGHDIEWERTDLAEIDGLDGSGTDLVSVIDELEGRVGAVPLGLVTAVMSERGATIGETLEAVRELRMDGKLYEPRDDHLRVT